MRKILFGMLVQINFTDIAQKQPYLVEEIAQALLHYVLASIFVIVCKSHKLISRFVVKRCPSQCLLSLT